MSNLSIDESLNKNPRLRDANELFNFSEKSKKSLRDQRFNKCIDAMMIASNEGLFEMIFKERLTGTQLNDLKKLGYLVEIQYDRCIQYPDGVFSGYKISWKVANCKL